MNSELVHYLLGQHVRTLAVIKLILNKKGDYISNDMLATIRGILDLPGGEPPTLDELEESEIHDRSQDYRKGIPA